MEDILNTQKKEKSLIAPMEIRDNSHSSFSHQLDVTFIFRIVATIMLSITTQIPLFGNYPLTKRKVFVLVGKNKNIFLSAKLAMANLLASLLRLATAPGTYWCALSTSTHIVSNVVRGRNVLLRHSVKHYEASLNDDTIYI